ncbi:MAG TPA: MFS transporter [Trebonia sp.]|jgi:MFS family permease|nr:MFS transporter [Trebonia sp.]
MTLKEELGARAVVYTQRQRLTILVFALIGSVFDGASFSIFIYFLHPLSEYFHVSLFEMTLVQSMSYVTGIAGGWAFGFAADRWGRRLGLTLTIGLFSLATLASAFSPSYGVLFALRIVAGLGIGGESGIAAAYLNEAWRSEGRGLVNSFLQGMFILGGLVATFLYQVTSADDGSTAWRWAFGWIGLVAILAMLVRLFMPESKMWLEFRRRQDAGEVAPTRVSTIFAPEIRRATVTMSVLMIFAFWGAYSVITYGPTMWESVYHSSSSRVAIIGYLASTVTFVSYLIWGGASDRFGRRKMMIWGAVVGTAGYVFFAVIIGIGADTVSGSVGLGSLLVFYAYLWMEFGYGYVGVQGSWMAELFPTEIRATASNFAYYFGRGIGAGLVPLATLAIAQTYGGDARAAIAMGAIGTAGVVAVSLFLPESRGKALQLAVGNDESVVAE